LSRTAHPCPHPKQQDCKQDRTYCIRWTSEPIAVHHLTNFWLSRTRRSPVFGSFGATVSSQAGIKPRCRLHQAQLSSRGHGISREVLRLVLMAEMIRVTVVNEDGESIRAQPVVLKPDPPISCQA
ncbi:hypothetical protein HaLaN_31487, partial [Haematococcus lacustris]